jgi:hypothetical protein
MEREEREMKRVRTTNGALLPVSNAEAYRVAALRRKYAAEVAVHPDGQVVVYGREVLVVGRERGGGK